ncbi:MAG: hypothetical protein JWP29_384 [Rhodoferax sp.]|nr:hypothetical protein [Rhodoferax sp.]
MLWLPALFRGRIVAMNTSLKLPGLATCLATCLAPCLLSVALGAHAQLPRGDLSVELRQVEDQPAYIVSTQPRAPQLAPQQVLVKNGEKATLRMAQAMPVKWLQSAAAQSGRSDGAAVSYGLVWMEAGQAFTVTPRWPGGKQAASVQIEVASASVDASTGAELPNQQRSQLSTTISAPLGQWVTVASTGGDPQKKGVYSSNAANDGKQLIQVRVQALGGR